VKAMLYLTFHPRSRGSGHESSGKGIARYFVFKEQYSLYGIFSSYPIYRNRVSLSTPMEGFPEEFLEAL
jgi:hypothetical protein